MGIFKRAFKDTLPVLTGYLVLGLGFGILLNSKGYNALWAFIMSVVIYSGTAQFVFITFLTSGASLAEAAITSTVMGARHLFYGISMLERYNKILNKLKKIYMIHALTDETYALVSNANADTNLNEQYYFYVSLLDQSYWVAGSVLGALLGAFIPFNTKGVDFSLTALFITICSEQWLDNKNKISNHLSALTGFAASLICLAAFGRKNFLIPAMIAIIIILFLLRSKLSEAN
ncbi:MAG: AzlC family ABC transporter permease [Synergistaceae bacterium]|nr:AzlC family ABC transporter permease [Synergistaceae bacterium]